MVSQEPLFKTLSMKDVQTSQLADFFGAIYLLQANSTGNSGQLSPEEIRRLPSKGFEVLPDKLTVHGFGKTQRALRSGPPLLQRASR